MLSILTRQFGGEFRVHCLRPKADPEGNLSSIVFVRGRTGENLMPSPPPLLQRNFHLSLLQLIALAERLLIQVVIEPLPPAFSDQKLIFVCVGEFHHCLY